MSKAVVYSKQNCPWCVKAKQLLTENGVEFEEILYGTPRALNKEVISEAVGKPINTVPQIILDGVYIGGYTDLAKHYGVQ